MMARFLRSCALCLLAGPASAQTVLDPEALTGTYQRPGMSCTSAAPGEPDGPVLVEADRLVIGGLECGFISRSSVARMSALLIDASCMISNRPKSTRLFVSKSNGGITIVSRELGTFVLESCM
jgi:hypothetical protein